MLFHVHRGQMRFRGGHMVHIPKSPRGRIMMRASEQGAETVCYFADKLGNMDIEDPQHIDGMMGVGYPLYDGDGKTYPVPLDDLIWPNLKADSQYMKRCLAAISEGKAKRRRSR